MYQALTRQRCFLFYELLIVLITLYKKAYVTFIIKNLNEVFSFNSHIKHCLGLRERGNPDVLSSVKPPLAPETPSLAPSACIGDSLLTCSVYHPSG